MDCGGRDLSLIIWSAVPSCQDQRNAGMLTYCNCLPRSAVSSSDWSACITALTVGDGGMSRGFARLPLNHSNTKGLGGVWGGVPRVPLEIWTSSELGRWVRFVRTSSQSKLCQWVILSSVWVQRSRACAIPGCFAKLRGRILWRLRPKLSLIQIGMHFPFQAWQTPCLLG